MCKIMKMNKELRKIFVYECHFKVIVEGKISYKSKLGRAIRKHLEYYNDVKAPNIKYLDKRAYYPEYKTEEKLEWFLYCWSVGYWQALDNAVDTLSYVIKYHLEPTLEETEN